jgi:hypothetical protein
MAKYCNTSECYMCKWKKACYAKILVREGPLVKEEGGSCYKHGLKRTDVCDFSQYLSSSFEGQKLFKSFLMGNINASIIKYCLLQLSLLWTE